MQRLIYTRKVHESELAEDYVELIADLINKEGEIVDVKARSTHKILADEAKRVTKLLPKMKPGKQNGQAVNVNYSLPILLDIQ